MQPFKGLVYLVHLFWRGFLLGRCRCVLVLASQALTTKGYPVDV